MSELGSKLLHRIINSNSAFLEREQKKDSADSSLPCAKWGTKHSALTEEQNERHHRRQLYEKNVMKHEIQNQSHSRILAHMKNADDYELKLKEIATLGVLKFFNALEHAQTYRE